MIRASLRSHLLLATGLVMGSTTFAQSSLENVIVETYYLSSAADAVETEGGILPEGSKTYRVYLDLCDSCALLGIYGSEAHPLDISSTAPFYNNLDRGKTFGHEMNNSALDENTVALDSWLSLGAASNQRFGVLKSEDADGITDELFPNDNGMLGNNDAAAGIPLTQADGLLQDLDQSPTPGTFTVLGDSPDEVFGDNTTGSSFSTFNTLISCQAPGVRGHGDGNKLLIAQLTTTGDLTFCINVEVVRGDGTIARYVHNDTLLAEDETANGLLCYPPTCGCMDPQFLEYDPTAGCDDGSCQTAIVFGCMDVNACNFDEGANFNLDFLCCYGPDSCNGLDATLICPGVGLDERDHTNGAVQLLGNPFSDVVRFALHMERSETVLVQLTDMQGRCVLSRSMRTVTGRNLLDADLTNEARGPYVLRVFTEAGIHTEVVLKQ